jgi:hypothetical protein
VSHGQPGEFPKAVISVFKTGTFKHICAYMCSFSPQVLYTVCCLSKLYTHKNVYINGLYMFSKQKIEEKRPAEIGTSVQARVFNVGLLARSQFASGRFCFRPSRSRISEVFRGFRSFQRKCCVSTQIPRCTVCLTCSPPNGNIKNIALKYPSYWRIKIRSNTAFLKQRELGTDVLTYHRW